MVGEPVRLPVDHAEASLATPAPGAHAMRHLVQPGRPAVPPPVTGSDPSQRTATAAGTALPHPRPVVSPWPTPCARHAARSARGIGRKPTIRPGGPARRSTAYRTARAGVTARRCRPCDASGLPGHGAPCTREATLPAAQAHGPDAPLGQMRVAAGRDARPAGFRCPLASPASLSRRSIARHRPPEPCQRRCEDLDPAPPVARRTARATDTREPVFAPVRPRGRSDRPSVSRGPSAPPRSAAARYARPLQAVIQAARSTTPGARVPYPPLGRGQRHGPSPSRDLPAQAPRSTCSTLRSRAVAATPSGMGGAPARCADSPV